MKIAFYGHRYVKFGYEIFAALTIYSSKFGPWTDHLVLIQSFATFRKDYVNQEPFNRDSRGSSIHRKLRWSNVLFWGTCSLLPLRSSINIENTNIELPYVFRNVVTLKSEYSFEPTQNKHSELIYAIVNASNDARWLLPSWHLVESLALVSFHNRQT